jgi:hypothetical protein
MAPRTWLPALAALALAVAAASGAEEVAWPEAVDYVALHGSPSQFYGPVAKGLGLSDGTGVDYRAISKPGDPKRDFYVTDRAVVLSVTWQSGSSRGYTASKDGVLLNAMDRNRVMSLEAAASGFKAEKAWWIATISAEKAKARSY